MTVAETRRPRAWFLIVMAGGMLVVAIGRVLLVTDAWDGGWRWVLVSAVVVLLLVASLLWSKR